MADCSLGEVCYGCHQVKPNISSKEPCGHRLCEECSVPQDCIRCQQVRQLPKGTVIKVKYS